MGSWSAAGEGAGRAEQDGALPGSGLRLVVETALAWRSVALVPWPQELTDPRGDTRAAPRSLGNHR